ncbi:MAG: tetratricopeptide repeat protein [Gemmatimonadales bacterium]
MTPSRTIALLALGSALAVAPARAQEPCPRASGADAEAGWTAYAGGDMDAARARFGAALARCDDDQYARTGMGYVLLRAGSVDEAVAAWTRVVAAEPDNLDALTGLGLAAWRRGDVAAVQASFTRVVAIDPQNATARDYLARISAAGAEASPTDEADRAWAEGNSARALELYDARLRTDPTDETALLRSALLTAWQGRYADASTRLDRLLQRAPGHLDARLARARVRAWSGDVPGARREVEELLRIDPDNREALEALALFQTWSGEIDESLGTYDELISISPEGSAASRMRARALARASRFEASLAAYRALLEADPDDDEARLGLAEALAYAQDFDASIAEYDRVLAGAPAEMRALLGKSRALSWAGRLVEAERVGDLAVEADARSAPAWTGLGQIYRAQGRPADALEAFETAAELAPTDAEALDQLRSVRLGLAPLARPTVVVESDSDDNRMLTWSLSGGWHPTPRVDVQARVYRRDLEQGIFSRTAHGTSVVTTYELTPGWRLTAGVGGSRTNGSGTPTLIEVQAGVRTPERHRFGGGVSFASTGLNETAALAELGGRSTEVVVSARWTPTLAWRVDGSIGAGKISGTEDNGRRSASLSTHLRLGGMFSLGAGVRGFSFEKDLFDGYFDPDFYGVGELTGQWLYRPGPWTLLAEVAPGVQKVRTHGDVGTSLRTNALVGYRIGPGRDVSVSFGYSSAGLVGFRTGTADYNYTALIIGSSWAF